MRYPAVMAAAMLALGSSSAVAGNDAAIVVYKSLSPETALEAARAALRQCRADGFQVAVTRWWTASASRR